MLGRREPALVLCAALVGCGGLSGGTQTGPIVPVDAGPPSGDGGPATPVGEACTAAVSGGLVVTFSCVVSHTNQSGDVLLVEVDPRAPVTGMSSFYGTLQAKTTFAPGTFASTDFASVAITLTTGNGTPWTAKSARMTLKAISPATATASYDTGDVGTLDATLVSPAGATAPLHIAF